MPGTIHAPAVITLKHLLRLGKTAVLQVIGSYSSSDSSKSLFDLPTPDKEFAGRFNSFRAFGGGRSEFDAKLANPDLLKHQSVVDLIRDQHQQHTNHHDRRDGER